MGRNLYVGNLAYSVTEDELRNLFEQIGAVETVNIITDRETGRPRGFGFVKMTTDEDAQKAVEQLNGRPFLDRALVVNEARPKGDGGGGGAGYRRY
ncbi:MAG: RNA recognition motif domain-containing protein [Candidatus Eisenbacteria bacterium]|nr:RNA-binding protein [Candidatus Eisenbacteria bacterium]